MKKGDEKRTALSYIDKYPITRYMDGRHIDYTRAAVRANVDIRVVFIGFDEICRELLLASICNDQLVGIVGSSLTKKQIGYYILSPDSPWNGLQQAFRYQHEFLRDAALDTTKYFKLPEPPSVTEHICAENEDTYFATLTSLLSPTLDTLPLFRVIISEAMCSSKTIARLNNILHSVGAAPYTKVFAFALSGDTVPDNVIAIQMDSDARNKDFETAAKERNRLYFEDNVSNLVSKEAINTAHFAADAKWDTFDETTRNSNIFSAIGMRLKMNLLGLDITSDNTPNQLSKSEYNKHYYGAKFDMPDKDVLALSDGFGSAVSPRDVLAMQEHMRWNAFMICEGYVPASKADCFDATRGYGKSAELKLHRNIASIEGLVEYRRLIAEHNYRTKGGDIIALEQAADVIKYDYQLMDDAFRVLARLGKSVIRRE